MALPPLLLLVAACAGAVTHARALTTHSAGAFQLPALQNVARQTPAPPQVANSSCHGFLLGIGTQKGGTTALWAYLADHAHPHLQVPAIKEVGYWDRLHTRYAGCRVGDYLQLLASSGAPAGPDLQLPLCPASTGSPVALPSTSSSAMRMQLPVQQGDAAAVLASSATSSLSRLKPSLDCKQASKVASPQQGQQPAPRSSSSGSASGGLPVSRREALPGSRVSVSSFKLHDSLCPEGLFLPGDIPPARPWWWLFGGWPGDSIGANCLQKQGQPGPPQQQPQSGQHGHDGSTGSRRVLHRHPPCEAGTEQPISPSRQVQASQHLSTAPSRRRTQAALLQEGLSAGSSAGVQPQQQSAGAGVAATQPLFHVDITPRYLLDPAVPLRVRALLPEARLLVMLRDPVSRAVSNFNMWWQSHRPPNASSSEWASTLAVEVEAEVGRLGACYDALGPRTERQPDLARCLGLDHPFEPSYDRMLFENKLLAQGMYADSLQRWFQLFPAESFMVWSSEDFRADPAAHIRQLATWLGLDPALLHPRLQPASTKAGFKPVHARKYEGSAHADSVARMRWFFEPHNRRLFELLEAKGFERVAARLGELWR